MARPMNAATDVRKMKHNQGPLAANPVRLLLADDHDIVIIGLRSVLDQPDIDIVGTVKNGRALVQAAADLRPDVVIADIAMPLLNGIDAARKIRSLDSKVKIIFATMHADIGYATEALPLGNCGYVLKSSVAEELPLAIRAVLDGRIYVAHAIAEPVRQALEERRRERIDDKHLTTRQREVLQLLAEGHPLSKIAQMLKSNRTVEFHKYRIMEVLFVHSVAELVRSAIELGIILRAGYRVSGVQ
jgi:DNA-binding NarL/FixJ family response regulator